MFRPEAVGSAAVGMNEMYEIAPKKASKDFKALYFVGLEEFFEFTLCHRGEL
jgi:hypothetical protein